MHRRQLLGLATGMAVTGAAGRPVTPAAAETRNPAWPQALTMGTASPGGTYAAYGPAWGALVERSTGVGLVYRATQGPNQNIILLDRGEIDLGMTTMGVARQAWEGVGGWTGGARFRGIRALFPMYDTPFHGIALAASGITNITQLAGRTLGIGPAGGTAGLYVPTMLRVLGIGGVTLRNASMADMADMVVEGRVDACLLAAGAPIPGFADAEQHAQLSFLGFTGAEAAKLRDALPELSANTLAHGVYRSLGQDLPTVGMFNFALCRESLPDDLAYAIVAAVLDDPAGLTAANRLGAETQARQASRNGFLPFHPGAVRYYREKGVRILV